MANVSGIILQLEADIESIRQKIIQMQDVTCPHCLCAACQKKQIEQDKEKEMLAAQMTEKGNLILELQRE
jgi:hypothetical protein